MLGAVEARRLLGGQWGPLFAEAGWGVVHRAGYGLVPALFLRGALGTAIVDCGLRWGATTRWLGWCALPAARARGA